MIKIAKEAFAVSKWSGGTTTQLFISPKNADLGRRNFDMRISSASFTTTSSKFSDFSGYTRFILPLKGTLSIRHPNRDLITLSPYEVYRFDGGAETDSENSIDCIDFNLIVKHKTDADLEIWHENCCEHPMKKGYTYFLYSMEEFRIHVSPAALTSHNEGSPSHTLSFEAGALHIFSPEQDILAKTDETDAPVVVCKVLSV